MTNAEKYLKEGISAEEFVKAVWGSCYNIPEAEGDKNYKNCMMYGATIERWLKEQATPKLTEDERVILRNINNMCKTIYREKYTGHIRTTLYCPQPDWLCGEELRCFDNLFQFIKNGEEYSIEELLK